MLFTEYNNYNNHITNKRHYLEYFGLSSKNGCFVVYHPYSVLAGSSQSRELAR